MDWWEKFTVQNCDRELVKPKNQPGGIVLAPWWLKWSTVYTVDVWAAKKNSNTGYSQSRHLPVPEAAIWVFHTPWINPCYNQPQVSGPKFRLETNSTVLWLCAGSVSLILPDVWFGTVSLDWVTIIGAPISQYASYSVMFKQRTPWKHLCNPSSHSRKYGEYAHETHAPYFDTWKL